MSFTDKEIYRLARAAKLPKIMWDTEGYRASLARFAELTAALSLAASESPERRSTGCPKDPGPAGARPSGSGVTEAST